MALGRASMIREVVDEKGRKYQAHTDDSNPPGGYIVIGPPEGLVDTLGLPDHVATRLHNILYERKLFNLKSLSGRGIAHSVIQELYSVDAQKLSDAFLNFENVTVGG